MRSLFVITLFALALAAPACSPSRTAVKTGTTNDKESSLRRNIVRYASQFKGAPYVYAGKNPRTGFDCSGFTSYVMAEFDVVLSPSSREQAKQGRVKNISQAEPGDLVFFRRGPGQPVFHVALIVDARPGSLSVIHATTSRGVIVEDIMSSTYWNPKIYQVREVL